MMADGVGAGVQFEVTPILGDLSEFMAQIQKMIVDIQKKINESMRNAQDAQEVINDVNKEGDRERTSRFLSPSGGIGQEIKEIIPITKKMNGALESGLRNVIGTVQDIYKRLMSSSPLLQSIEQLFNLAVSLFFMPLGNKLATVMLPAILQLVDGVMEIWDKFEGQSLGDMINTAITEGSRLFGEYFISLGQELRDQGGIVGTIGDMIIRIGAFIKEYGEALVGLITKILEFVISNIPLILGTIITMKALEIGSLVAIAINTGVIASVITAGIALGVGALVGKSVSSAFDNAMGIQGYADGGYVPPTPGGKLIRVAERGEGEYITPESKKYSGGNTYNITINGMTTDELKAYIVDVVDEKVNESRLRSGL